MITRINRIKNSISRNFKTLNHHQPRPFFSFSVYILIPMLFSLFGLQGCGWAKGSLKCETCELSLLSNNNNSYVFDSTKIQKGLFINEPQALNETPSINLELSKELDSAETIQIAIGTTESDSEFDIQKWVSVGKNKTFKFTSPIFHSNQNYFIHARIIKDDGTTSASVLIGNWQHKPYLQTEFYGSLASSYSFVDLDIDWNQKIAYLASRESGKCITAVDFIDPKNPTVLKIIGTSTSPATISNTCLGVKLYKNNSRLVVTGMSSNSVEVWDLGSNPRTNSWTRLSSLSIDSPRRLNIQYDPMSSETLVDLTLRNGYARLNIAEPSGTLSLLDSVNYGSNSYNDSVLINNYLVLADDNSSSAFVKIANISNLNTFNSDYFSLSSQVTTSGWGWTASVSPSGPKVGYLGGQGGAFIAPNSTTGIPEIVARHDSTISSGLTRGSDIVIENNLPILYAAIGSSKIIARWDLSDIYHPRLTHLTTVPNVVGEIYGIKVHPESSTAIIITNGGQFLMLKTNNFEPATVTDQNQFKVY